MAQHAPITHIEQLVAGLDAVSSDLSLAEIDLTREVRRYGEKRRVLMHRLAEEAIPRLDEETLISLVTNDLRIFGSRPDVQYTINTAVEKRPRFAVRAIRFLHETENMRSYATFVSEYLPEMRRELKEHFERHIASLERLADVRAIDVEINALRQRLSTVTGNKALVQEKLVTLQALRRIFEDERAPNDAVVLEKLEAGADALERAKAFPSGRGEFDPLLGWLHSLPGTMTEWGVRPTLVA